MLCENCKKNTATVHLTEITEGQRTELHLCEICASEQGVVVKSQIPINELLSSLLASQPSEEPFADFDEKSLVCPNCGFSLEQFHKEAVMGCPNDYEVFEKALLPLIKKAHDGKTLHCGKIPSKTPRDTKKQIELSQLNRMLQTAVQAEDYEKAAELRDKIKRLKDKKNSVSNKKRNSDKK
jgi:protein arginine kinase activator